MTRQDYEIIAKVLARNALASPTEQERGQWLAIVNDMADTLERHNVGFNKERFLAACARR